MFKGLIEHVIKPIIPRIEGSLFEKDDIFDDNKILDRGIFQESISENGDSIELIKKFVSADNTFSKTQITEMSKESFVTQINKDLITLPEAKAEITKVREQLEGFVKKDEYEKCAVLKHKLLILEKIVSIKTN